MQEAWVGSGTAQERESGSRMRAFQFACTALARCCFAAPSLDTGSSNEVETSLSTTVHPQRHTVMDDYISATIRGVRNGELDLLQATRCLPIVMGADLLRELMTQRDGLTQRHRRTPNFSSVAVDEWIRELEGVLGARASAPNSVAADFILSAILASFMDRWSSVFLQHQSPVTILFWPADQVWRRILAPLVPGETNLTAGALRSIQSDQRDIFSAALSGSSGCTPFLPDVQPIAAPSPPNRESNVVIVANGGGAISRLRSLRLIVGFHPLKQLGLDEATEDHPYFGAVAACVRSIIRRRITLSKSSTVVR